MKWLFKRTKPVYADNSPSKKCFYTDGHIDPSKLDSDRLSFVAWSFVKCYDRETNRVDSILQQTSRLQVFQSIFTAAYFMTLPTIIDSFCKYRSIIWKRTALFTLAMIISMMLTLLSQHRFRYNVPVRVDKPQLDDKGNPIDFLILKDGLKALDLECYYILETYPDATDDLARINKKRIFFLNTATIFSMIACAFIIWLVIDIIRQVGII